MDIIEFLKAVFLGIVEGITEWLPISSTGHMILVDEFIKLNVTPEFKEFFLVVIQLGAILAVVVLYWGKLWPFYIRELPKKQRAIIAKQPVFARGIMTFVERFCDKEKWVLWFKIDHKACSCFYQAAPQIPVFPESHPASIPSAYAHPVSQNFLFRLY